MPGKPTRCPNQVIVDQSGGRMSPPHVTPPRTTHSIIRFSCGNLQSESPVERYIFEQNKDGSLKCFIEFDRDQEFSVTQGWVTRKPSRTWCIVVLWWSIVLFLSEREKLSSCYRFISASTWFIQAFVGTSQWTRSQVALILPHIALEKKIKEFMIQLSVEF